MRRRSIQLEGISVPKYKYSFNDKTFDLSLSGSLDSKIGAFRAKPPPMPIEEKIKSSANFTLDKLITRGKVNSLDRKSKTDKKDSK